jgi:hypothetical protein
MTGAEKDATAEDRGKRRDNIGDAGKIWMGTDGESSGGEDKKKHLQQQSGGQEWVMELGVEKTRSTRKVPQRDNGEITYQCSVS